MTPREELIALRRLAELEAKAAGIALPAPEREELFAEKLGRGVMNAAAGAIRGAGSIGATIIAPYDIAKDAIEGKGLSIESNRQRRADMDAALSGLGADTDSLAYGGGKLLAEIAGTAGVGGQLANVASRVPLLATKAAPLIESVRSAGMVANGLTGARGVAARMAGGAISGGASALLVNPSEGIGREAAIGAVAPPLLSAAGFVGKFVGSKLRSRTAKAGDELARALELGTEQDVAATVAKLRSAQELVPGSAPSVAQILRTPQSGILQRVIHDSAGGAMLRDQLAAQNAARLAALERVAPTSASGYSSARQDMGEALSRFANTADDAARARISALYKSLPQDEAVFYLPDLSPIQRNYYGPGVFTDRSAVDKAVSTAQKLGSTEVPGVVPARAGAQPKTLAQAVRSFGGISLKNNNGYRGEVSDLRGDFKNLVRKKGGLSPEQMAMRMREAGYIADENADTLFQALRGEATGGPQYSSVDDLTKSFTAAREAAVGDVSTNATRVPQKVTLKDFEDLRKSIGQEQRAAGRAGNNTAAKALGEMKKALDDRIDDVVRGDGAIDENLPIDWADKLTAARKAKVEQISRFRTGPQASIFRQGADGQPVVQGGEVAAKFWGQRPGVADDVKAFRRLIDDKEDLLGQFRSMITTEGADTQTAAGNLSSKFSKWVENSLPGLKEAFDKDQVKLLQRISHDIKRADAAAAAGMSRGSNTYQNSQNALQLGLLDNPILRVLADRIPVANSLTSPALAWGRDKVRYAKAQRLAELLF